MKAFMLWIAFGVIVLAMVGCGEARSPKAATSTSTEVRMAESVNDDRAERLRLEDPAVQGQAKGGGGNPQPAGGAAPVQPVPRKIIYNAEVRMVVDDLSKAEESLKQLLKKHDGFVAQSELTGSTG
jgi:hypothetical protein